MKIRFFLFLMLFNSIVALSQENDQRGYYIDEQNNRFDVFFKYIDVLNEGFLEVKTSESDKYSKLDVRTIKEYGIGSEFKFVRATVKADVSSHQVSLSKDPKWETKTVFLNTLLEGKASLYSYYNGNVTQFFFISEGKPLEQLVYKKYHLSEVDPIKENTYFKNQIFESLKCNDITIDAVNLLKYNKSSLLSIFEKYSACSSVDAITFSNATSRKSKILLKAYAGVYSSSFKTEISGRESEAANEIMPALGIEVALKLPNEKLEFFLRAEYEKYDGTTLMKRQQTASVAYNYLKYDSGFINFGFGPRYNFLIKDNSNFFVDASVNVNIPLDDVEYTLAYPETPGSGESKTILAASESVNLNIGIGYNFNKKMGLDLRMDTNSNMLGNIVFVNAKHSRIGLNFRYTIL